MLHSGNYVKVYEWNGLILDVFKSNSGRIALEIYFAKDAARSKRAELHVVEPNDVSQSSKREFDKELLEIRLAQDEALKEERAKLK